MFKEEVKAFFREQWVYWIATLIIVLTIILNIID